MWWMLIACTPDPDAPGDTDPSADTDPACDPAVPSLTIPDFLAPLDEYSVVPSEIDPATDQQAEDVHKIFVLKSGATLAPLFVMLPGTDGRPANNQHVLSVAAHSGYRAIGLAYPTETNQNDLCGDDVDCAEAFTVEKAYGTDETSVLTIDEPNSVVGRLTRLLVGLDNKFPGSGWDAYLERGAPKWSNIVMAGFSQGSGLASWIAKDHELARFVIFSTGCDNVGSTPETAHPAPWCYLPRATPSSRTFGILHTKDHFSIKRQVYEDAFDLDAFGAFVDADTASPAYCTGSHIVTTSLDPAGSGDSESYHRSLATDEDMPVDANDVPLLAEDQWYLMAGGQ